MKKDEIKKVTIDDLAIMVNKGFEKIGNQIEQVDNRVIKLENEVQEIKNTILFDQLGRISRLEDKVFKLENTK